MYIHNTVGEINQHYDELCFSSVLEFHYHETVRPSVPLSAKKSFPPAPESFIDDDGLVMTVEVCKPKSPIIRPVASVTLADSFFTRHEPFVPSLIQKEKREEQSEEQMEPIEEEIEEGEIEAEGEEEEEEEEEASDAGRVRIRRTLAMMCHTFSGFTTMNCSQTRGMQHAPVTSCKCQPVAERELMLMLGYVTRVYCFKRSISSRTFQGTC